MYKAFLSWRYMVARRTNLIGIFGILIGVGALIMILSIMTGFLEETKKTVRNGLADIIVEPNHLPNMSGRRIPFDPAPILAEVRADPRVAGACAQLAWGGGLIPVSDAGRAVAEVRLADLQSIERSLLQFVGVDVADEYQTTALRQALEREELKGSNRVADIDNPFAPPPGYEPDGRPLASILLGEQLAWDWNLSRGSVVELMTWVDDEEHDTFQPNNRRYVVAGTFRSGENETDIRRVYLERAELANFIGPPREFSNVLLKLHDFERDGETLRADLEQRLYDKGLLRGPPGSGEVRTWTDYRKVLLGAIENERVLMAIMLSLVVVVAAFTIFAILSMMVTEKRRDVGILSALGATPGGVTWLFLFIAFWDALIGGTLGAIFGTWGALKIDAIERWLSSTFGVEIFNRDVYLFDHIPAVVNPMWVGMIVLGAFICTLVFAFFPAFKAGRMHPLDALRYE